MLSILNILNSKIFPIVASCAVLIGVALLQSRSRTLAAVLTSLPLTLPLSIWIIYSGSKDAVAESEALTKYVLALLLTLGVTILWLVVVYVCLRSGWSLPASIVSGYVLWVIVTAGLFWFGVLRLQ